MGNVMIIMLRLFVIWLSLCHPAPLSASNTPEITSTDGFKENSAFGNFMEAGTSTEITSVMVNVSASKSQVIPLFTKSQHYQIKFLTTRSSDCITVSVQDPQGPVFNRSDNVRSAKYYQTLVLSGKITVERDHFPNGILVVIVKHENASLCAASGNPNRNLISLDEKFKKEKTLEDKPSNLESLVYVSWSSSSSPYIWGLSAPLSFIGFMCAISLVILARKINAHSLEKEKVAGEANQEIDTRPDKDIKFHHNPILFVGAFYIVPLGKQIIVLTRLVLSNGNQDLCFSNFGCSKPYSWISDLNHAYSNLAFILLGILAFVIIHRWEMSRGFEWRNSICKTGQLRILYAMAWTMMMEGLLRGSYHVCPNSSTFYTGTEFLFLMTWMTMLNFYVLNDNPTLPPYMTGCWVIYTLLNGVALAYGYKFLGMEGAVWNSLFSLVFIYVADSCSCIVRWVFTLSLVFTLALLVLDFFFVDLTWAMASPVVLSDHYSSDGQDLCAWMDFYTNEDLRQFGAAVLSFIWIVGIMMTTTDKSAENPPTVKAKYTDAPYGHYRHHFSKANPF